MISIIIPHYNQSDKLGKCLQSILNQTYENYEVIIVDDGSSDNFRKVIKSFKSKFQLRLELIEQDHANANVARNRGAKRAKGEYLLFCDADIEMENNMLKKMKSTLEGFPEASYTYSSHKYGYKNFKLRPFDARILKTYPYIHTTSLIRRNHFPEFDEKVERLQDWDLWLTMLEQNHVGVWIDEYLFKIHPKGHVSYWMPSFVYKIFPFLPKVKKYKEAVLKIKNKHSLV